MRAVLIGSTSPAAISRSDASPEADTASYWPDLISCTISSDVLPSCTFTWQPVSCSNVAVVVAPAILKRKEVFGLLARTIVDDIGRDGKKVAVLRFDASHIVGESAMDPRLVAEGRPYYHWTFGHLGHDIEASLQYLERRFRPAKRVLVSVSLSA